mgnify:CR=1
MKFTFHSIAPRIDDLTSYSVSPDIIPANIVSFLIFPAHIVPARLCLAIKATLIAGRLCASFALVVE